LTVISLLLDNEEEAFLEDRGFADSLPGFVEGVQRLAMGVGGRDGGLRGMDGRGRLEEEEVLETSTVEVLFGVAANVRVKPLVLRVWFRPEVESEDEDEDEDKDKGDNIAAVKGQRDGGEMEERKSRWEEFPLFYLLLRYVPAEGRAGDFARMGLLYIAESTGYSKMLERWLVEGDMAAFMASGLGALYSQLSRKLALTYAEDAAPAILKYSTKPEPDLTMDTEQTSSPEYQTHLATFLSSLIFWQDLLQHCASLDVKQTLLDHFQFLFLQQLLYPSLLESSDAEGGSSVAVLTYLRHILESVDQADLIRLTLMYLFGLHEDRHADKEERTTPITKARRRKSILLSSRNMREEDRPTPELFNLGDLILGGLKSHRQQTVAVTLQLLSTLLRRQHRQVLPALLRTRPVRPSDELRTVGGHQKEIDNLLTLAESLTTFQDLEASYEKHIYDSRNALEMHTCTFEILDIHFEGQGKAELAGNDGLKPYVLAMEDPTMASLVTLLDNFLSNDIETNLALTQVILDVAMCGYLRLEGWLTTLPEKYVYQDEEKATASTSPDAKSGDNESTREDVGEADREDDETAARKRSRKARFEPAWHTQDRSPIAKSLDKLLARVESFHRDLQDFDALLLQCRREIRGTIPRINGPTRLGVTTTGAIPISALKPASASALSSRGSSRSSSSRPPGRTHRRGQSITERIAGVFGASPREKVVARAASPTPSARLMQQLSHASTPGRKKDGRRFSGGEGSSGSPSRRKAADNHAPLPSSPLKGIIAPSPASASGGKKGHGRHASEDLLRMLKASQPVRGHMRHSSLRGEDLMTTPNPDFDRRVVPHSGERVPSSEFRRKIAIGNDDGDGNGDGESSDEDEEEEKDDGEGQGSGGGEGGGDGGASDDDSEDGEEEADELTKKAEQEGISVGQLVTSVIVLQEFVLELAALIDVRATMFGEVRF